MIRFNMPKLRIYQQILICFGLIVTVPLVGTTFIINGINQQAMKKEIKRFTEHTAEGLYRDFTTEMTWQKQQSQMMAILMSDALRENKRFEDAARNMLKLDNELDSIGLYDSQGRLLKSAYRSFQAVSPELRLPDELPLRAKADHKKTLGKALTEPLKEPFQVIYYNSGNPQDSPYYLRAAIPLSEAANAQVAGAAYYVHQKNFHYLKNLVRARNPLYGAFYIVDKDGFIIAGPAGADASERISDADYKRFREIKPGVTQQFSSTALKNTTDGNKENDDAPALEKVIVKMPEINWGIIIESPYHMKQKYIKRAGTHTLLLVIGCLVVMLLLVLPYILGISRNFRQLIKGVKAMGEGNYFRRIRLITNFFTPYEIVYLTLEFNRMARKTADSWQTIQEANRKLAQMDEFKSNLIDTVSHELRTPLTSIKGYTSRLLRYDNTLDADTRVKSLKIVKQQADRLSRLVEDLLVIPDLEAASLRVYPDQVALGPLLENSVQFIQAKDHREIQVSISPALEDESLSVLADPDRLEQILLNLLDNAVKYSLPETPIEVRVEPELNASVETTDTEPTRLAISVINPCDAELMQSLEDLDSLFDKFKRMDDSLVRTTRGSGLGLFITRGLVEAMSGQIRLFYHEGQFQVRFTIPVYRAMPQDDALTLDVDSLEAAG